MDVDPLALAGHSHGGDDRADSHSRSFIGLNALRGMGAAACRFESIAAAREAGHSKEEVDTYLDTFMMRSLRGDLASQQPVAPAAASAAASVTSHELIEFDLRHPFGLGLDEASLDVEEVPAGGQGSHRGVRPGWRIVCVNNLAVSNLLEFRSILARAKERNSRRCTITFASDESTSPDPPARPRLRATPPPDVPAVAPAMEDDDYADDEFEREVGGAGRLRAAAFAVRMSLEKKAEEVEEEDSDSFDDDWPGTGRTDDEPDENGN